MTDEQAIQASFKAKWLIRRDPVIHLPRHDPNGARSTGASRSFCLCSAKSSFRVEEPMAATVVGRDLMPLTRLINAIFVAGTLTERLQCAIPIYHWIGL